MEGSIATENQNLADTEYWDGEWSQILLPARLNPRRFGERGFISLFNQLLPRGPLSALEVGCAPGRYLLYFAEHMGYRVTGIDFAPLGSRLTEENLNKAGVRGKVVMGDFLTHPLPQGAFDVVFSAGFIEHFIEPMPVLQRMRDLLRPGGYLLTTVPNFAGFTGLLRKWTNRTVYDLHNPLSLAHLQAFYQTMNLDEIHTGFFGSVRLQGPRPSKGSIVARATWQGMRVGDRAMVSCYDLLGKSPEGPWLSSHLYAVGRTPLA